MHEFFSREPDPVEGMLRPPTPTDNEALRQEVYTRTRLLLHRRRHWLQLAYAAALLVSFAVGAGTVRMMPQPSRPELGERVGVSPPVAPRKQGADAPRSPAPDESALAAEYLAFDSEKQRGELYRQAGDRYMTEQSDPQSALRCYVNALDNATEQELTISTNDNWLLMVIKDARQKENNHAKQGG